MSTWELANLNTSCNIIWFWNSWPVKRRLNIRSIELVLLNTIQTVVAFWMPFLIYCLNKVNLTVWRYKCPNVKIMLSICFFRRKVGASYGVSCSWFRISLPVFPSPVNFPPIDLKGKDNLPSHHGLDGDVNGPCLLYSSSYGPFDVTYNGCNFFFQLWIVWIS